MAVQIFRKQRGLTRNSLPCCVSFCSPGGSAHLILLRKEYGCVIAEPGAEAWPIQIVEVLYEFHEECSYRGRCDVQNLCLR